MAPSFGRGAATSKLLSYTLDFKLSSALDRLLVYSLRKYPSLQAVIPKRMGSWPDALPHELPPLKLVEAPEDRTHLTYLGQRTVYIQMEGIRLLTDPVLSKRLMSGGFGVKRVSRRGYKYWELPPVDFVLLSNNAFDCMDTWTLRKITDQGGAIAVGGRNLTRYMNRFYDKFTYPLSWFEEVDFGSLKITFVPAASETRRKLLCCGLDRNRLLWGGFLLRSDNTTIYYAGKTNYSGHFQDIKDHLDGLKCKIDIAILPIGPTFAEKRNMGPEDAVAAHLLLKPRKTLVVAHDTFPLGIEAFGELKARLVAEIERVDPGIRSQFLILEEGETLDTGHET